MSIYIILRNDIINRYNEPLERRKYLKVLINETLGISKMIKKSARGAY